MSEYAFSAMDPLGNEVVCYQSTMDMHRLKHPEPFSNDDIIGAIENPDMIGKTGHVEPNHSQRLVYYRDKSNDWPKGMPRYMKVVADHGSKPGKVTSMSATSKPTHDGGIVYIRPDLFGGKAK